MQNENFECGSGLSAAISSVWGEHACSVLVATFCRDELYLRPTKHANNAKYSAVGSAVSAEDS